VVTCPQARIRRAEFGRQCPPLGESVAYATLVLVGGGFGQGKGFAVEILAADAGRAAVRCGRGGGRRHGWWCVVFCFVLFVGHTTHYTPKRRKKRLKTEIWRCDMRCEKKRQIQRGEVFEEYKHNLVGVTEQLN
jgi:hypothetical protein